MAASVLMPKLGNSVESVILVAWKKQVGDAVAVDDALCEVETDKATMEVPSTVAGILLARLVTEGAEVAVMTPIAVIGAAGEVVAEAGAAPPTGPAVDRRGRGLLRPRPLPQRSRRLPPASPARRFRPVPATWRSARASTPPAWPAAAPAGVSIERDVQAAAAAQPKLTPVAKAMIAEGGYAVPPQGSGPGGRVTSKDLIRGEEPRAPPVAAPAAPVAVPPPPAPAADGEFESIAVRGVRKIIAERMLQLAAEHGAVDDERSGLRRGALLAYRQRLKASDQASLGLQGRLRSTT